MQNLAESECVDIPQLELCAPKGVGFSERNSADQSMTGFLGAQCHIWQPFAKAAWLRNAVELSQIALVLFGTVLG